MAQDDTFLPKSGGYRNLITFKKAECIYQITYHFAHRFLNYKDRTIDQMVQAARSGKQNIVEGSVDSATSKEMEIRLTNAARGSLQELLQDYRDYLGKKGLQEWPIDDERRQRTKRLCRQHNDVAFFMNRISERSDEAIANIAITLLCQIDYLLDRQIKRLEADFLKYGGIKEQMYRARQEYRNRHPGAATPGTAATSGTSGTSGTTGTAVTTGTTGTPATTGTPGTTGTPATPATAGTTGTPGTP